jgi:phosphoglycerate dehydrogenase-like enzyme
MKSPKAPKASASDEAMIARQGMQLNEEIAKNEKRLKAVARGGLGTKSLLGTAKQAAAKEVGAGSYSANRTQKSSSSLMNRLAKKVKSSYEYSGERK